MPKLTAEDLPKMARVQAILDPKFLAAYNLAYDQVEKLRVMFFHDGYRDDQLLMYLLAQVLFINGVKESTPKL